MRPTSSRNPPHSNQRSNCDDSTYTDRIHLSGAYMGLCGYEVYLQKSEMEDEMDSTIAENRKQKEWLDIIERRLLDKGELRHIRELYEYQGNTECNLFGVRHKQGRSVGHIKKT